MTRAPVTCEQATLLHVRPTSQVGYFHTFIDGVDYVFVDHPCYHNREKNIYGGDRADLQFR